MTLASARRRVASERTREAHLRILEPRYAVNVADYFRGMTPRISPAIVDALEVMTKADASTVSIANIALRTVDWDQETRILSSKVVGTAINVETAALGAVETELGLTESLDLAGAGTSEGVATRIRQVTDGSRQRIANMIADGSEKGLSVEQIVKGVRPGTTNVRGPVPAFPGIAGLVDSWSSTGTPGFAGRVGQVPLRSSRAYLIALTETGNAYNNASLDGYQRSGFVDYVEVFDGVDCGWLTHTDPDLAHGSIRPIAEAKAHALSHPRCQRAFGAAVGATGPKRSPFAGREKDQIPGASPGVPALDQFIVADGEAMARQAAAAELRVSATLERIRQETGAEFEGFSERLKNPIRISEKAAADRRNLGIGSDEALAGINDSLRYTFNFADDAYAAGVRTTLQRLRQDGIELITRADGKPGFKNFWTKEGYQGVNAVFKTRDGVRFELQFGTEAQSATKILSHKLYEAQRVLSPGDPRIAQLEREIADLWRPIHLSRPKGVDELDDWLKRFLRGEVDDVDDAATLAAQREATLEAAAERIRYTATHETAVLVDNAGNIILDTTTLEARAVHFEPEELIQFAGNTLTHNHPVAYQNDLLHATSLSPDDVGLMLEWKLREIRAVGKGADYSMTVTSDQAYLFRETINRRARELNDQVRNTYMPTITEAQRKAQEILSRGATEARRPAGEGFDFEAYARAQREATALIKAATEEAERLHWHRVWSRIALEYEDWLLYRQVLRPEKG